MERERGINQYGTRPEWNVLLWGQLSVGRLDITNTDITHEILTYELLKHQDESGVPQARGDEREGCSLIGYGF